MPVFCLLPDHLRPLADKFYSSHRSAMRTRSDHRVWVARDTDIVAALCLQATAHGQWLTSLLVAPALRQRGLASALIAAALSGTATPTWLFCRPDLQPLYAQQGFRPCVEELPSALAERLARYRRTKTLDAMVR
ncbi:Acetyltransferase (GNAT) domain-containing protein [Pseudomonas flavescens]|uniref:Acetyltransferase (GNAT) domain-containing protein n=1 Tax=Phytopseudomonas flavescens TaxID=29435 RepID=A0A1G7XWV0_9GAMM|nr:GNAT family N-acetyltransferase [Pseudomonas flavescens]SDG88624.1 Acetyltransferase (GNAT) domain-containing protein [Pseudomonas flavescens]